MSQLVSEDGNARCLKGSLSIIQGSPISASVFSAPSVKALPVDLVSQEFTRPDETGVSNDGCLLEANKVIKNE